jgi:anti-sigma28 factor (negative regulator of flagellin synthesis)
MGNTLGYSQQPEGLKSRLRVTLTALAAIQQPKSGAVAGADALGSAYTAATLLRAWSEALLTDEAGVRPDKVAAVQAALAAGTYHVPASAVASMVLDYMLVH